MIQVHLTISFRICFLLCLFLSDQHPANAQILQSQEKIERLAKEYFSDLIAQREFLNFPFSVLSRGEMYLSDEVGVPLTCEYVFASVEHPGDRYRYFAFGKSGHGGGVSVVQPRFWQHGLSLPEMRYERSGYNNRADSFQSIERKTGVLRKTRSIDFDHYYLPLIPNHGTMVSGGLNRSYGSGVLLLNSTFVGAETDKEGRVHGFWRTSKRRDGAVLEIVFGNSKPHRPVQCNWRMVKSGTDLEAMKKLPAFARTKSKWESALLAKDGKRVSCQLPIYVEGAMYQGDGEIHESYRLEVRWILDDREDHNIIPSEAYDPVIDRNYNWLNPIMASFEDDLRASYWSRFRDDADRHGVGPKKSISGPSVYSAGER